MTTSKEAKLLVRLARASLELIQLLLEEISQEPLTGNQKARVARANKIIEDIAPHFPPISEDKITQK